MTSGRVITPEQARALADSDFGKSDYYPNSFNDLPSGFITLFELLVVNNWQARSHSAGEAWTRSGGGWRGVVLRGGIGTGPEQLQLTCPRVLYYSFELLVVNNHISAEGRKAGEGEGGVEM